MTTDHRAKVDRAVKLMANEGLPLRTACKRAGVSMVTYYKYRDKQKTYEALVIENQNLKEQIAVLQRYLKCEHA